MLIALAATSTAAMRCTVWRTVPPRCRPLRLCADELSASNFQAELDKRGLQTALDALAEDGPSAFKDASKVIEYVMLSLQHKGSAGIEEAFRFTARKPGTSSFVSGLPLSSERVSWRSSRFIGGQVSGKSLELDGFAEEVETHFSWLLNCASWRWAVVHPTTFEPLMRSEERDFVREYVLEVDDRPVAVQCFYDWGCWCYLIYRVIFLDEAGSESVELGDAASRADEGYEGRSSRARGGSL